MDLKPLSNVIRLAGKVRQAMFDPHARRAGTAACTAQRGGAQEEKIME
jgi:hypothetical protein